MTEAQARRLEVTVERLAFVQPDGSVDSVQILELRNRGDVAASLSATLDFEFKDSTTSYVRCWAQMDGKGWIPCYDELLPEEERFSLNIDGDLQSGSRRVVALKVRREDLAEVGDQKLNFNDPFYKLPLTHLNATKVLYRATIIFPENAVRRRIEQRGAIRFTSRTASWDWGDAQGLGKHLQMRAENTLAVLPSAPRRLDDSIAEAYHALASIALADEKLRLSSLRENLKGPLQTHVSAPNELFDDAAFASLGAERQMDLMRELIDRLHAVRTRVMEGELFITVDETVLAHVERIAREIERKALKAGVKDRLPKDCADALVAALRYQHIQRHTANRWSTSLNETEFQGHFQQYLTSSGLEPGREVKIAGGRADFLLGQTPVELKVKDLQGNPANQIRHHLNQAAEYAAAKGRSLGVLIVLDEHPYRARGQHLPAVSEQVRVDVLSSEPGLSGSTSTLVVSIIVPAFPPEPSGMGAAWPAR